MRKEKYAQDMFDEKQLKCNFHIDLVETCSIYRVQYPIM